MKLGLASDLHLDFADINPEFFDWRGDVLLLAGDLAEEDYLRKHCHEFFDKVSAMAEYVLVISGNHEFYRSELDVADAHLDSFLEQWSNIIPLRNIYTSIGHLDFFGATMWTDFNRNPIAQMDASMRLNDYQHIRLRRSGYRKINPNDVLREHQLGYNALLNWLETGSGRTKIVMTHHAPSIQSVPAKYRHEGLLNYAYCNAFERLIENDPRIAVWAHGHTHDYFDYQIGLTRILCNPRGYPNERPAHLPPYQPKSFEL